MPALGLVFRFPGLLPANPIILDLAGYFLIIQVKTDLDTSRFLFVPYAVLNCIFNKGLYEHGRYDCTFQQNIIFPGALKGGAQEAGKIAKVVRSFGNIFGIHQAVDAGKGIENKMWVHLQSEQLLFQQCIFMFVLEFVLPQEKYTHQQKNNKNYDYANIQVPGLCYLQFIDLLLPWRRISSASCNRWQDKYQTSLKWQLLHELLPLSGSQASFLS